MTHQVVTGKIANIGERTRKSGKTHIDHLVIVDDTEQSVAFSNVVCENEMASILKTGDDITIGVASVKKFLGGSYSVVTALKNAQIVVRNAEYTFAPAIFMLIAILLIAVLSRGLAIPLVLIVGFYLYTTYNREKSLNDLAQETYDSFLKL